MNPVLFIMCGRSFAGKTTLRKELIKRFKLNVASVDERIDIHKLNVEEMTQEDWNMVYSETYDHLKKLLSHGKSTILDMGNLEKHERDTARAIAKDYKIPTILIYVNTTLEEVKNRWIQNQKIDGGRKMDEKVFNKAQEKFQEPTPDENPIVYNNKMDLGKWIEENLNQRL